MKKLVKIKTTGKLFRFIYDRLNEIEPRFEGNDLFLAEAESLIEDIEKGGDISGLMYWSDVIYWIEWGKSNPSPNQSYSLHALHFIGRVTQAMKEQGVRSVSHLRAVQLLNDHFPNDRRLIKYWPAGSTCFMCSNARCERDFGTKFRFRLKFPPHEEATWWLGDEEKLELL